MTLINRFAGEFTDDGNRHLLPIIRLALGVAAPKYRWGPETLPAAGTAVSPWTAELAPATRENLTQATAGKKPIVTLSNAVKTLDFDGVDDEIAGSFGGVSNADNPNALTMLMKVDVLPAAGVTQVFGVFGGGTIAVRGDGMIQVQFLATDAGAAPYANSTKKVTAGKWFTVSVVATRNGFHEYTLADSSGLEHVVFGAGNTRGLESLKLGTYLNTYYHNMSVAAIIAWPREISRAERETLATSLPKVYPVTT